jgi:hypothetical protein
MSKTEKLQLKIDLAPYVKYILEGIKMKEIHTL